MTKSQDYKKGLERLSMLNDLIHCWTTELPPDFNIANPDVLSLCYYPLKIATAGWMTFVNSMEYTVERYEYSVEGNWLDELKALESHLRYFQRWRRRAADFEVVVCSTAGFIRYCSANPSLWEALAREYDCLAQRIDWYGQRFEAMVPVLASLVQSLKDGDPFKRQLTSHD
ncbi:hypothetical protein GP486_004706 [Trichoglossum hirsutum]|uniref:Uncharacterized protein n=1 Tax=Trichoglossum hirsutum TaxID=265104 RepID=A0A9P8LAN5_9PEZI|nr:hypothetical protein GP486_004706 [Trichoglossum hirsutum]